MNLLTNYWRFATLFFVTIISNFAWSNGQLHKYAYEGTITNITKGQTFTPQLLVTHDAYIRLFELGQSASSELEVLAEAGNTGPLTQLLYTLGKDIGEVKTVDGLLGPGESISTEISAPFYKRVRLSMAAMLIPTNDTFVGMDSIRLPRRGERTYLLSAYDAGTEFNDQNCLHIPGPRCGGQGSSDPNENDEGYVYIGNGFHELGKADKVGNEILGPYIYDWRNPVAQVRVKRIYNKY